MILTMAFTLALNFAAPAAEEQLAPRTDAVMVPPDARFAMHSVVIGVGGHDSENNSSKFMEYRSYPNGAVLPYLAMSYLYKRSNWLWRLLIHLRLTARVWRPLVELSRRRHLRFRRRLAERQTTGRNAETRGVVSAGV